MNVVLLIRSLGCGGAERQLTLLAKELALRHRVSIVTFYDTPSFYPLDGAAVEVVPLGKRNRWDVIPFLWRLSRAMLRSRPDVVYAFMSSAALVSLLVRLIGIQARVIWGIRSSNMELPRYGRLPGLLRILECRLSRYANLAIANSEAGRRQALADGFSCAVEVIANGIDTRRFCFDPDARRRMRLSWGVGGQVFLIGVVARHDPMKGYEIFLRAAASFLKEFPNTRFISVGMQEPDYSKTLLHLAETLGLEEQLIWVGTSNRVVDCYSAFDVFSSSSIFGEGFSNALGEAMSCGLPCVATDVGDSKRILGDAGMIVPPADPTALADAWSAMARSKQVRQSYGARARQRIELNFSTAQMLAATETVITNALVSGEKRCG
jgi:glycosyltransferase involved in cell wall biosynthesis